MRECTMKFVNNFRTWKIPVYNERAESEPFYTFPLRFVVDKIQLLTYCEMFATIVMLILGFD